MAFKKQFQNQDTEPFRRTRNFVFSFIVLMLRRFLGLRRRVSLLGERVEWVSWLETTFGEYRFFWARESLWNVLLKELDDTQDWTVLEFGVAWGYTSNYWLKRSNSNLLSWHGFDRFTGLPRSWRDLEENTFSADGAPPPIKDPRVVWHVGDVEQQLPMLSVPSGRKVVLFDLDLYEPTAFAWNYLFSTLAPGDLLYFDEAFDNDERQVITELLLPNFDVSVIGATHTALAFRLIQKLPS